MNRRAPGLAIFLSGLSGAGKSSLSQELSRRMLSRRGVEPTLLDGDEVRRLLSSELGFSREHRDLNVARMAFVAAEVARHGGICVVAAIMPFEAARREAMARVLAAGGSALMVHVSTSLAVCEGRDPKGLYAKARSGRLTGFTGVGDPYEEPVDPGMRLDLGAMSVQSACDALELEMAAVLGERTLGRA